MIGRRIWAEAQPTSDGFQLVKGGGLDMFLTEMSPSGASLIYSTYLGGTLDEDAYGLAVDAQGNGYLAGRSMSTNTPVSTDAFQATFKGTLDAFVAKIQP